MADSKQVATHFVIMEDGTLLSSLNKSDLVKFGKPIYCLVTEKERGREWEIIDQNFRPVKYSGNSYERQSGRSTRIIDACIQELFETGKTCPQDHYWDEKRTIHQNIEANKRLIQIIFNRLHDEHHNVQFELKTLNNQLTQIVLKK